MKKNIIRGIALNLLFAFASFNLNSMQQKEELIEFTYMPFTIIRQIFIDKFIKPYLYTLDDIFQIFSIDLEVLIYIYKHNYSLKKEIPELKEIAIYNLYIRSDLFRSYFQELLKDDLEKLKYNRLQELKAKIKAEYIGLSKEQLNEQLEYGLGRLNRLIYDEKSILFTLKNCTKLIIAEADINVQDNYGRTVLIWAIMHGNAEIIKLLIDAKVDVNVQDNYGKTALIWAAKKGHAKIVKLLIDSGADINTKDKYGETALIWATTCGHFEVVKLLKNKIELF